MSGSCGGVYDEALFMMRHCLCQDHVEEFMMGHCLCQDHVEEFMMRHCLCQDHVEEFMMGIVYVRITWRSL